MDATGGGSHLHIVEAASFERKGPGSSSGYHRVQNCFADGAMGAVKIGRRRPRLRRPDWSQRISPYGMMASAGVEGALSSLLELTAVVT
jgi:hypothetical protein